MCEHTHIHTFTHRWNNNEKVSASQFQLGDLTNLFHDDSLDRSVCARWCVALVCVRVCARVCVTVVCSRLSV